MNTVVFGRPNFSIYEFTNNKFYKMKNKKYVKIYKN